MNKFTIQKSFAISAGAGSGKTYTLSRRYINALLGFDYFREDYTTQESYYELKKPAKVSQIVTITYTEAAALEMKGRIFGLIAKVIDPDSFKEDGDIESIKEANSHLKKEQLDYVQTTLKEAFAQSSHAKISTIHSYCLDIIKSNADIAKIDTSLDIIKEDQKEQELQSIIFEVFNSASNKQIVLDITSDVSMFLLEGLVKKYVSDAKFRSDFDSFDAKSISQEMYKKLILELYPLPDTQAALKELEKSALHVKWFEQFYNNFINFEATAWKDVFKDEKAPSLGAKTYPIADATKKELEKLIGVYAFIDEAMEQLFFTKITQLKTLLQSIKHHYDTKLQELGKIDFDTIITKTLAIISQVSLDYKYIMVDEFQDTNATQFAIIKHSMNKETNLFVVGDSKQSIYSFQGAQIEVFNNAIEDTNYFSSIEDMSQNFRSDRVVLDTINTIFKKLLQKEDHFKIIKQDYEATPQDLTTNKEGGSFRFLITPSTDEEPKDELESIALFVKNIVDGTLQEYSHITKLINKQEQAIAIVFDSSTQMVSLKEKLKAFNIDAKVSASEHFYHTKEITDIFHLLKAIEIIQKAPKEYSNTKKYYLAAAMRSFFLRLDDESIKNHLQSQTIPQKLKNYCSHAETKTLSELIKYIYDDSNILGVYAHFGDVSQVEANLQKFLILAKEYEQGEEGSLYHFLEQIEKSIYFSEAKEDEAFFVSNATKSIEICSIHATKGLAYPLVLLAGSTKSLFSQINSDTLKHNNITINNQNKEIVGFKVGEYIPLSFRVLKMFDRYKHLAEKKRLLYVALTRAQHDLVISAHLKQNNNGTISLAKDSYLHMIIDSLELDKEELFAQNEKYCIELKKPHALSQTKLPTYVEHTLKPLTFTNKQAVSATQDVQQKSTYMKPSDAALLGTITHAIIQHHWRDFRQNKEEILNAYGVFEQKQKEQIALHLENFYKSELFTLLSNGVEHHFELEFYHENKHGFIDCIYYDDREGGWVIVDFKTGKSSKEKEGKYQKQLDFYKEVVEELGYKVLNTQLLWV